MRAVEDFDIGEFLAYGKDFELFDKQRQSSYILSYPYLVNYFRGKDSIGIDDLIVGSHFVYGWMPTILDLNLDDKEELLDVLNKAKTDDELSKNELEVVKKSINNSIVGGSKLLHFINPKKYPIWDSRVYRNIHIAEPYSYRVNNVEEYQKYLWLVNQIIERKEAVQFHKTIEREVGYSITKVRAIELMLFTLSIQFK